MINIKYGMYKYAPETLKVTVNGKRIDTSDTNIAQNIVSGNKKLAFDEIKRIYRKSLNTKKCFTYGFLVENSKQFYFIRNLTFNENATLKDRLYCYKTLKKHLLENPIEITIQEGTFTPNAKKDPDKTHTVFVNIDFSKRIKICLV